MVRAGLLVAVIAAGCASVTMQQRAEQAGKSGNWGKAMAAYDFEYERAAQREKDLLAPRRDAAAMAWIRGELGRAKAAGNSEVTFGIVTTLSREAKRRKLAQIDADEIQPVAKQAVLELLPMKMGPPLAVNNPAAARREARMLIAVLDTKGATEARAAAALLMKDHAERETKLAAAAKAAGLRGSAYLHEGLADDYAFRVRTASDQATRDDSLDHIARSFWMMAGGTSCTALEESTRKFGTTHNVHGTVATILFDVTRCNLEPDRWETREQKTYLRKIVGSTTKSSTEGSYQRTEAYNKDGSHSASQSSSTWVPGSSSSGQTQDSAIEVVGVAIVSHVRHRWQIDAKITFVTKGEPDITVRVSTDSSVEVESWEIPNTQPGDANTRGGNVAEKLGPARAAVEDAIIATLKDGARQKSEQRAQTLAAAAAAATSPEVAEDFHIASIRATNTSSPTSMAFLEQRLAVPSADVLALITGGATPDGESALAFQLAVPPPLEDKEAMKGTIEHHGMLEMRTRALDGAGELMAGLVQSAAPKDQAGDPGGTSAIGVGVGLVKGVYVDPGVGSGTIFEAAMDFRVGYAGALFYDTSVPVALGRRFGGFGVTLLGTVGFDKFGSLGSTDLYVNVAPYYGYGVGASFLTAGAFDISASYLHVGRNDGFGDMGDPVISDEDRFELRVLRYSLPQSVLTVTGRYAQYSGDMQDGRIITLWVGASRR